VVERSLPAGRFVANDTRRDADARLMLLTGPNMAGKSTYLRQVALIVLLAQVGSFVPAARARLGVVDRIFTRIGAHDDIAAGRSTFMVEMIEAATIVRSATPRSLVVLDEVGRGTSTFDGMAIAQAIVEELHERVGARTLFATHFHELAGLADDLARVRADHTAVSEEDGQIVFLRRVEPGAADRSYGIHVARLAGLPASVTVRAEQILGELETPVPVNGHAQSALAVWEPLAWTKALDVPAAEPADGRLPDAAWPKPGPTDQRLLDELLAIDLATTTPLQALNLIAELQRRVRAARA
jgi:DNA mismatch repair protein MutS